MRKFSVLTGAAVVGAIMLVALLATATFAQSTGPADTGPGMMDGQGIVQCAAPITSTQSLSPAAPGVFGYSQSGQGGYGPGMMSGFDSECGGPGITGGQGMMADQRYARFAITGKRQTAAQVRQAVVTYLAGYYNNPDLALVELMAFGQNFYARFAEKSTKINAGELLIDPYTGAVQPEYGPNRMWNTKYGQPSDQGGMMPSTTLDGLAPVRPTAKMPVTAVQASDLAQQYLDAQKTGLTVEKGPNVFYGYYTIHSLDKAGNTAGMLSVNGYTGQVWNHIWQGKFIGKAKGV